MNKLPAPDETGRLGHPSPINCGLQSADGFIDREAISRALTAMLENFDLELLQKIDRFLRELADSDVSQQDVEQMLGTVLLWRRSGRGRQGYPIGLKAVRCARLLDEPALLMNAVNARGNLANGTLDIATAIECYLEALQLAERLNDRLFQGRAFLNLGTACGQICLELVAVQCLQRALVVAVELQADPGMARALECIASCSISAAYLDLGDYRLALLAARRCQLVGAPACAYLEPGDRAHVEDAIATSRCNEVRALLRLGMYDEAKGVSETLDAGTPGNPRGPHTRIVLAQLNAATGNAALGIEQLLRVIADPLAQQHRRGALEALVECYESDGQHDRALFALRELHAEVEASRREVAIEELQRLEGINPALDQQFEKVTQNRLANYLVEIDGIGSRLSAKLTYLNEIAVSAEIREGNEANRAEHVYRVGALSSLLAAEAGCSEKERWLAEVAGRLHDVGKSSIPDAVALKLRPLSLAEWRVVQAHSDYGARLVVELNEPKLVEVVAALRHHHERFDGSGYPNKLKGEDIPLLARIVAISESFDAMRQSRTYRPSRSVQAALGEIERGAGSQFDPRLAGLFVQVVRRCQRQVDDLDVYLGEQGRSSSTVQTFAKLTGLFATRGRT
jgi:putative two-component system response regulator